MHRCLLLLTLLMSGCITDVHLSGEPKSDQRQRAEARVNLAIRYMEQGNMVKARENLEQAIEHDPNYYRAQLSLAHYYERVEDYGLADRYYRLALQQAPNKGTVLNNYGAYLCKRGEFEAADHYFNQAIEKQGYYLTSASYENAALCAVKAKAPDKAIAYFKRALDYEPYRPRSMLSLAKLELQIGKYDDARNRLLLFQNRYGKQKAALLLLDELESKATEKSNSP